MAGLGDLFNKGSLDQLGRGIAGAAGQVAGKVINEAAKPTVDKGANAVGGFIKDIGNTAGNVAKVTGAKTVLATQYPETLPLAQSSKMTQFVENGLTALGHFNGKPDGTADGQTLTAINKLRASDGGQPLADLNEFKRDDVGLMVEKLARHGTPHAQTVLNNAVDTLGGLKEDYPKPQAPAVAPSGPQAMMGGS